MLWSWLLFWIKAVSSFHKNAGNRIKLKNDFCPLSVDESEAICCCECSELAFAEIPPGLHPAAHRWRSYSGQTKGRWLLRWKKIIAIFNWIPGVLKRWRLTGIKAAQAFVSSAMSRRDGHVSTNSHQHRLICSQFITDQQVPTTCTHTHTHTRVLINGFLSINLNQ